MGETSPQLTPKQQLFVDYYIIYWNATKAAKLAGYSEKTAQAIGSENLTKPLIKEAIDRALKERSERIKVDADWLLTHLSDMLKADIADILDELGDFKPIKEWPLIWRQMLQGIDLKRERQSGREDKEEWAETIKAKFVDTLKTAELAGKHIGVQAFKDRVEHEGTITLESILETANGGKSKED